MAGIRKSLLARCRSAEGAALCPSDMMLCVIPYWVLSGAKRRQIQQLRCCVLPAKMLKRRDVYLKLTRHNGRAGTHGTYNPKHNDRSFNLANSEHIDQERAKGNIYWDCFHGFRSVLAPPDPDDLAATFSDVERRFYETHYTAFVEAIVSPEEWAKVQELIDRRPTIMTGNDCPYYNIFHGIIYCATCGKSMQARYEKVGRKDIDRTTKKKREPIDKAFFTCQTYNRIGCKVCSSHKIEARDLHELVLNDIQELAAQAMKDSDAFYQRLSRRMENQYRTDTSEVRAEIRRLEERNQEIDDVFLNLYTDKSKGIISEQRFLKLTDAMEQEQNSNKTRLSELNLLLHQSDEQESDVHAFIEEIRKYAAIKELDEVVLNRLIKKIMIGEVQKVDGQKIQEVKIIYNFVGEISA